MSKATDFISNRCCQLGNPIEPLIFKTDALEAVRISFIETEERDIEVYRQLCPCYQKGKCKNYPHSQKQGTSVCDMECERIRRFKEKLTCISINHK